jgi:hypothetical protein
MGATATRITWGRKLLNGGKREVMGFGHFSLKMLTLKSRAMQRLWSATRAVRKSRDGLALA